MATVQSGSSPRRLIARERARLRSSIESDEFQRHTYDEFGTLPRASASAGYGNPTGTTGAVNLLSTDRNIFEYVMLGAGQTLLIPAWLVTGLDIALDQAAAEGVEMSQGITARSRGAFTVGTDDPFSFRVKAAIEDVSGADEFAVGWRKAAAYAALIDNYTDFAVVNVQRGTVNLETALNNAATVTTDTTLDWTDGSEHEIEVQVNRNGSVRYLVDGAVPPTVAAFTFDTGDVVVPFVYFLHHADLAGKVELREWECGFVRR